MEKYFTLFQVTEEAISGRLQSALSLGGDYADIFFESTTSDELTLRDGEVNAVESTADYGVGIRVLKEGHTGYAYAESTLPAEMERAARTAAGIADTPGARLTPAPLKRLFAPDRYPILGDWNDFDLLRRKAFLQHFGDRLSALSGDITKVIANLAYDHSDILFANSLGELFCDERPITSLVAHCILERDGRSENIAVSRSYRRGSEMLTESLLDEMVAEVAAHLPYLFEARRPKGGEMPVVMAAGSSGILLHEAIGHAFEADFNRKGISIFSDKMGKRICSPQISVVDDATIAANRGAVNIDDEGVPGQKTYMVREGVLTSYLHDRISAAHYSVAPTGNGRRESFRFNPIPRMRCTYMENGSGTQEEIIRSVKRGIFVDAFTNGQVEIGAGDFTFYVKSGFLIENGRLTQPIKDINIIGNGPEALADIVAVAADSRVDDSTWTCGKDQYCPVSCGMPSVLVKSLIVGGDV